MKDPTLLTEPMSIGRLADLFGVHRTTVPAVLAAIEGVVRIGRLVRVPVTAMPVRYLLDVGLLVPRTLDDCRSLSVIVGESTKALADTEGGTQDSVA